MRPPVLSSSWQEQRAAPQQQSPLAVILPKVIREVLIFGGLIFLAAKTGVLGHPSSWLAIVAGRGLVGELRNLRVEGRILRTVLGWVAVAVIAAVVVTASPTTAHKVKTPKLKAPVVNVEATQTDALDKARAVWADAYAKLVAQGASKPLDKPQKEGR